MVVDSELIYDYLENRKKLNVSAVFAGQAVRLKEVEEGIWLVSFMECDPGYIDLEEKTLQRLDNPFGPKGSPVQPVRSVTYLSGPGPFLRLAERGGFFPPLKTKDFGSSRFRALPISHRFWENSIPET